MSYGKSLRRVMASRFTPLTKPLLGIFTKGSNRIKKERELNDNERLFPMYRACIIVVTYMGSRMTLCIQQIPTYMYLMN